MKKPLNTHSIWTNPIHFIASGFGAGAMLFAPGTFGTLIAIPIYLVMAKLPLWAYGLLTLIFAAVAMWACDITARDWKVEDPGATASDEVIGFLVTMFAIPPSWTSIIVGFILFRFFDILKPFPISYLDRNVHGGVGIVLDDMVAGFFAMIILRIGLHWF